MYKELDLFPEEDEEEQKDEGPKVDLNPLFDRLSKSKFRSSFYLNLTLALRHPKSPTCQIKA